MRLYSSKVSPFSRKARLAALFAGLEDQVEVIEVTVSPIQPNMDLAQFNPLIKLPFLVNADGTTIYDSPVICEYFDSIGGEHRLIPKMRGERWRALTIQALCDGILDAAVLANQERMLRPEIIRWDTFRDAQMARIDRGLKTLSGHLPETGRGFGIGAISAICTFGYLDLRHPYFDWRARVPDAATWMAGRADHPFVVETAHPA